MVIGAISDLHQYFWSAEKSNVSTFVKFTQNLLDRNDKVAIMMDSASPHTTRAFRKFLEVNKDRLRTRWLHTGWPELGAIGQNWNQLKIQPFMFGYNPNISERVKISKRYLNGAVFKQDVKEYLLKKPIAKTFWRRFTLKVWDVSVHPTTVYRWCIKFVMIILAYILTLPVQTGERFCADEVFLITGKQSCLFSMINRTTW